MRSQEELERLFGGPEGVRRVGEYVKRNVDAMPPLTARQRDALKVLFSMRTIPPRPAPPVLPDRMPPRPAPAKPRRVARSSRSARNDEVAAPVGTSAAA